MVAIWTTPGVSRPERPLTVRTSNPQHSGKHSKRLFKKESQNTDLKRRLVSKNIWQLRKLYLHALFPLSPFFTAQTFGVYQGGKVGTHRDRGKIPGAPLEIVDYAVVRLIHGSLLSQTGFSALSDNSLRPSAALAILPFPFSCQAWLG